jgi:hypothetical protein
MPILHRDFETRAVLDIKKVGGWRCAAHPDNHWGRGDDFLRMRVPNGRELAYPFPRLFTGPRGDPSVVFKDKQWGRLPEGAYGGTWTENAVQAVSRDLLVAAMPRLEAAGYPIVLMFMTKSSPRCPRAFWQRKASSPHCRSTGLPVAAPVLEKTRGAHGPLSSAAAEPADTVDLRWDTDDAASAADNTSADFKTTSENTPTYTRDGCQNSEAKASHGPSFIYLDKDGKPYLKTTRKADAKGKKTFPQQRWDGSKWVWGAPNPKIPYRLPELIAAPMDAPVWICEGEKDAESVAALGFIATTNSEGAGKGKWTADLNKWFARRMVYILEDNDATGRAHVNEVASALKAIAQEIKIVEFRDLPEHEGVSYWLAQGHTKAELLEKAKNGRLPGKRYELVRAEDVLTKNIDWLWYSGKYARTARRRTGGGQVANSQQLCGVGDNRKSVAGRSERAGAPQCDHADCRGCSR